jgi:hypothetical protein
MGLTGLLLVILLGAGLLNGGPLPMAGGASPAAHPASNYPPFSVTINGPHLLGLLEKASFVVTASGGPAELPNGTYVGNYSFRASLAGGNVSSGNVAPPSGVLQNRTVTLSVQAPDSPGVDSLVVEVSSVAPNGTRGNVTGNFTAPFTVVVPYTVTALLRNPNNYSVLRLKVDVALDGSYVGTVVVPSIAAGGSYVVSYNYTTLGLPSGWHTFTFSLAGPAGLVVFANGETSYSVSFYVAPPPPNYTNDYLIGIASVAVAIFILTLFFGPRRIRRKKS